MSGTFSSHAIAKIKDIVANGSNHVGSELKKQQPEKYKDFIASDCITMAIWVLKYAFEKTGNLQAAARVGQLGEKGTELAKYLIDSQHFSGVYYNPDVNHPADGSGEHIASYYNQVKSKCTYSIGKVPVGHKVINYKPSGRIVSPNLKPTKRQETDLNTFEKIPFGVGMSRGGSHVWLYSYGKVYESHWDSTFEAGLYSAVSLRSFPWLSGIIVVPADSHHLLTVTPVKCAS